MAFSNIDQILAGAKPHVPFMKVTGTMEAAGVPHSLFYSPGMPGAAAAPTSLISGDALTSYPGQLPMPAFANNTHLMTFGAMSVLAGGLWLCDRLWHNANINVTTTTGQTINSSVWPARDANGSTNGDGVIVGIEVSTATTNGAAITNTTLTYTNSAGTGSKTATMPSTLPGGGFPATAVAGTIVPFMLAAGDTGIRSIQTLTLGTSYGGGTIHLVAYRIIARLDYMAAGVGASVDAVQSGFPRMWDNTTPFLIWIPSATTTTTINGGLNPTQG